ncbi:MAG TPA: DUF4129 domain-containing protein [Anaeromyxobacter sp.]|nr:DUF4129 domain-containing protein [Anaeromyxobacter sp.]
MIGALLLSARLATAAPAPPCAAALARADGLDNAALAVQAPDLARELRSAAPDTPADAVLAEAARAAEEPGAAAGARFRAAVAWHCALAAAPRLPAAGAREREVAEEILERPAFRRARADPWAVRRWLLGLWERFLALFETPEAQAYARFSQVLFLAAAAAAAALGAWALLRRRPVAAPATAAPPDRTSPAPDARLDAAAAAAARGEAALAVRLSMLAALGALERDAVVPPGRSLTSAELVAHLRAAGADRAQAAQALCGLFDRTVYGASPASPADAAAALAAARALGSDAPGAQQPPRPLERRP